jgi:hypothetical protein
VKPISETPLSEVPGWTDDYIRQLRNVWITSAEQVVALAATPGGLSSLAEHLGITDSEADRLRDAARSALPEQEVAELETPADTYQYGTGALPPHPDEDRPR